MSKKYSIKEFLEVYNNTDFGLARYSMLLRDYTGVKWDIRDKNYLLSVDEDGDFSSRWLEQGFREVGGYMIAKLGEQHGRWVTGFFLVENRVVGLDEETYFNNEWDGGEHFDD